MQKPTRHAAALELPTVQRFDALSSAKASALLGSNANTNTANALGGSQVCPFAAHSTHLCPANGPAWMQVWSTAHAFDHTFGDSVQQSVISRSDALWLQNERSFTRAFYLPAGERTLADAQPLRDTLTDASMLELLLSALAPSFANYCAGPLPAVATPAESLERLLYKAMPEVYEE